VAVYPRQVDSKCIIRKSNIRMCAEIITVKQFKNSLFCVFRSLRSLDSIRIKESSLFKSQGKKDARFLQSINRSSLSNVAKLAAHPKFVWVFNANCDETVIYNDPVYVMGEFGTCYLQYLVNYYYAPYGILLIFIIHGL
jgi:hypothetical protein